VLADRRYRGRAQVLAAQIRQYDTFGLIEAELEAASATARLHLV
jgi:hypothetical protein